MNYEIWLVGNGGDISDRKLGVFFRDPWQRPRKGQEISLKGKIYKVLRTDPNSNPSDQMVKYYVDRLNPNAPFRRKQ